MRELSNTQFFQVESGPQIQAKDILEIVYTCTCDDYVIICLYQYRVILSQSYNLPAKVQKI